MSLQESVELLCIVFIALLCMQIRAGKIWEVLHCVFSLLSKADGRRLYYHKYSFKMKVCDL